MYERFTDRARKVMQLAKQEAERLNHDHIGDEHILMGLIKEGSGVAAYALKNLGLDLEKIRLEAEKIAGVDLASPGNRLFGMPQHTPSAKKVIEYSVEEARGLSHDYVGTEHLLLGLLREANNRSALCLDLLGVKRDDVRAEVLRLLGHAPEVSAHEGKLITYDGVTFVGQVVKDEVVPTCDAAGRATGYQRQLVFNVTHRIQASAKAKPAPEADSCDQIHAARQGDETAEAANLLAAEGQRIAKHIEATSGWKPMPLQENMLNDHEPDAFDPSEVAEAVNLTTHDDLVNLARQNATEADLAATWEPGDIEVYSEVAEAVEHYVPTPQELIGWTITNALITKSVGVPAAAFKSYPPEGERDEPITISGTDKPDKVVPPRELL